MKELKQAEQIRTWVQSILTDESSGHDWHHVSRVADLAAYIGEKEKADLFIVETAALVHDLIDVKLPDTVRLSVSEVYDQLVFFGVGKENADRLDAIGAVGIARAFMFAGANGHGLYGDEQSAYAHFFHKLLRLKDMMNTDTARELAEERHNFMLQFVRQLEKDIPGIDAETS